MAVVLFDVLQFAGRDVMPEPCSDRPKRLEEVLGGSRLAGVTLVPVTDGAPAIWDTWVRMGGEGIVLKDGGSRYLPGARSPAWLKVKEKLVLEARITGGL